MTPTGRITALYRHPIKGFTPEPLSAATFSPDSGMAFDRAWAVENGPSGFDPEAPAHISKMRFVALAPTPETAHIRTRLDDATGRLTATTPGMHPIVVELSRPEDREAFELWLTRALGDAVNGPLRVLDSPGHRFLDHPDGQISLTNRASLKALEDATGQAVDSRRLRGNIEIEGWPAFAEIALSPGARLRIGEAEATVVQPIRRCIATHVNPVTGLRDFDLVGALQALTGGVHCGVYVKMERAATISCGDLAEVLP